MVVYMEYQSISCTGTLKKDEMMSIIYKAFICELFYLLASQVYIDHNPPNFNSEIKSIKIKFLV